jgi:hypothetical protein
VGLVDDDLSSPSGDAAARCARALALGVAALALLLGSGVGAARAADGTSSEQTAAPATTQTAADTTPAERTTPAATEPAPAEETTPATTGLPAGEPAAPEPDAQPAGPPAAPEPPAQPVEVPPPPAEGAQPAPIALLAVTPPALEPAASPPSAAPLAAPIAASGGAEVIHASFAATVELPGPALPAHLTWVEHAVAPTRHSARLAQPRQVQRVLRAHEPAAFAVRVTASTPTAQEDSTRRAARSTARRDAKPHAAEPPARPPRTHSDGGNSGTAPGGNGTGDGPLVVLAPTPERLHVDEVLRLRIERPG